MGMIKIPYNFITEMDDLTLFLYASTNTYTRYSMDTLDMPIHKFYYDAYQSDHLTKKQKIQLSESLKKMHYYNLLAGDKIITIYPSNFRIPDGERFILIEQNDFLAIFYSNHRSDIKWAIFYYYCHLIMSLDLTITLDNRIGVVGHMSQGFFMDKTGLSQQTISKYHKYLEDLQLIYTNRCKYNLSNGKRRNNYYGRYSDRKLIDQFANIT